MTGRVPLTDRARRELRDRLERGDRSMLLVGPDHSALAMDADPGTRTVLLEATGQGTLTPDEARRTAAALLDLADHAEFGPGEFDRKGDWHPERRCAARSPEGAFCCWPEGHGSVPDFQRGAEYEHSWGVR